MQLHKDSKQQIGRATYLDNYKHSKSGNVNLWGKENKKKQYFSAEPAELKPLRLYYYKAQDLQWKVGCMN